MFNVVDDAVGLQEMREHGARQMNTDGQITASFYYHGGAPDMTMMSAQQANDTAHESVVRTTVARKALGLSRWGT